MLSSIDKELFDQLVNIAVERASRDYSVRSMVWMKYDGKEFEYPIGPKRKNNRVFALNTVLRHVGLYDKGRLPVAFGNIGMIVAFKLKDESEFMVDCEIRYYKKSWLSWLVKLKKSSSHNIRLKYADPETLSKLQEYFENIFSTIR